MNALPADIAMYVNQFDECVKDLSSDFNEICSVAVDLVNSEIYDWKKADTLKQEDDTVCVKLDDAAEDGKEALKSMTCEQSCTKTTYQCQMSVV